MPCEEPIEKSCADVANVWVSGWAGCESYPYRGLLTTLHGFLCRWTAVPESARSVRLFGQHLLQTLELVHVLLQLLRQLFGLPKGHFCVFEFRLY